MTTARMLLTGAILLAGASTAAAQVTAIKASQTARKNAHAPHRNTLTLSADVSDYSEAAREQQFAASLAHKITPRTTLTGTVTQHENFEVVDAQVQVGVTHALSRRALLGGSYTRGIGADVVAGDAFDLKLSGELSRHLLPFVEYNLSRFKKTTHPGFPAEAIDEHTFTVGGEMPFNAKTSLTAAYQYSHANDREGAHGITGFLTHQAAPKLSVHAGGMYAGAERLITVSKHAFIRDIETAGVSAGFEWTVSPAASIEFTYEFQRVRGVENIQKFSPALHWKF